MMTIKRRFVGLAILLACVCWTPGETAWAGAPAGDGGRCPAAPSRYPTPSMSAGRADIICSYSPTAQRFARPCRRSAKPIARRTRSLRDGASGPYATIHATNGGRFLRASRLEYLDYNDWRNWDVAMNGGRDG